MEEADVNAGAEWPTFDVPAEVPKPDAPPVAATPPPAPGTPATPPATPPVAATPPAQPTTPPGGAPATPPGPVDENVPKYRLDADREKFESIINTLTQQNARLMDLVSRGAPGQPPPPTPETPAPLTPQDLIVRDRLYQVVPELKILQELVPHLKVLAEKKDALLGTVDQGARMQNAEETYWDRYVERTLASIYDRIAVMQLGEGKTAKDLDDLAKTGVFGAFRGWVTKDKARADRYNSEDPKLIEEFWSAYKAAVYDPQRRDADAALLARAQTPPTLPIGGGGTPIAPAPPAPVNNLDEDAVHKRAWATRDSVGV